MPQIDFLSGTEMRTVALIFGEVLIAVLGCWAIYRALKFGDEADEYVSQEGRYWAVRREWREGDSESWRRSERQ